MQKTILSIFRTIILCSFSFSFLLCTVGEEVLPETLPDFPTSIYNGGSHREKLNDLQKTFVQWDEDEFSTYYDIKSYESKKDSEAAWIHVLEKPEPLYQGGFSSHYDAINGLAFLKSQAAIPVLLHIATERIHKDNSYRDNAIKALGWIGNSKVVPDLIPLVYFHNTNCRLNAQIALVRLTGQNFGNDWKAWGTWWNQNKQQFGDNMSDFDMQPVDWENVKVIDYLKNTQYEKMFAEPKHRVYFDPEIQVLEDKKFAINAKANLELKKAIQPIEFELQRKIEEKIKKMSPDFNKKDSALLFSLPDSQCTKAD